MTAWLVCVGRLVLCFAAAGLGFLCVYGCYREMATVIRSMGQAW